MIHLGVCVTSAYIREQTMVCMYTTRVGFSLLLMQVMWLHDQFCSHAYQNGECDDTMKARVYANKHHGHSHAN